MAGWLTADQMEQVSRRMHGTDDQLLLALKMARTWLPADAMREMAGEEVAAIGLATEAENRLRARM